MGQKVDEMCTEYVYYRIGGVSFRLDARLICFGSWTIVYMQKGLLGPPNSSQAPIRLCSRLHGTEGLTSTVSHL